jgi:hypothetical protein
MPPPSYIALKDLLYALFGLVLVVVRAVNGTTSRKNPAQDRAITSSIHPKTAPRVEGVRARVTVGNSRVASSVQSIGHCIKRTFVSAHREENGGPKCFESCLSSVQWRLLCCFQKGHSPVTVMAVTMVVTTAVTMVVTTAVTMVVATAVTIAVTGITAAGITAAGITAVGTVRVGVGAMVRVGVGAMADVCGLAG